MKIENSVSEFKIPFKNESKYNIKTDLEIVFQGFDDRNDDYMQNIKFTITP